MARALSFGVAALGISPMGAVAYPQEKVDKENILKGYTRYVLG